MCNSGLYLKFINSHNISSFRDLGNYLFLKENAEIWKILVIFYFISSAFFMILILLQLLCSFNIFTSCLTNVYKSMVMIHSYLILLNHWFYHICFELLIFSRNSDADEFRGMRVNTCCWARDLCHVNSNVASAF